jgi:hypothetical protein
MAAVSLDSAAVAAAQRASRVVLPKPCVMQYAGSMYAVAVQSLSSGVRRARQVATHAYSSLVWQ